MTISGIWDVISHPNDVIKLFFWLEFVCIYTFYKFITSVLVVQDL